MKELLLKRKSRFSLYILACFIPVLNDTLLNLAISLVIGSIQVGTMENLIKVGLISAGIVILGSIMYVISRFMRISFMRDTLLDVRLLAFDKILNSSYKNFSKKSKDNYISNLINDINIFESNFFLQLINVIYRGGVYIVSLTIIGFLDIKFAIVAFGVSILLFFISKSFEKRTVKLQEEVSERNEDFAVDMLSLLNFITSRSKRYLGIGSKLLFINSSAEIIYLSPLALLILINIRNISSDHFVLKQIFATQKFLYKNHY